MLKVRIRNHWDELKTPLQNNAIQQTHLKRSKTNTHRQSKKLKQRGTHDLECSNPAAPDAAAARVLQLLAVEDVEPRRLVTLQRRQRLVLVGVVVVEEQDLVELLLDAAARLCAARRTRSRARAGSG